MNTSCWDYVSMERMERTECTDGERKGYSWEMLSRYTLEVYQNEVKRYFQKDIVFHYSNTLYSLRSHAFSAFRPLSAPQAT